jgi:T1SS-143 domain-containing protein
MSNVTNILAAPEAGSSIGYTLNAGADAKFSFGTQDIEDIRMEGDGSLVITFANGGEISIENFQALLNAGTELTLADGMVIDTFMIENGFAKTTLTDAGNDNHIIIDVPSEGVVREITLEPGQDYYFNFELQSPVSAAAQEDGSYIMTFANGAKLVLSNYAEAMAWDNTPSLFTDTDVCALTNEELITTIQQLVMAPQGEEIIEDDQVPQSKTAQSDIQDGQDVADVAPAAGDDAPSADDIDELAALADALAEVQPAAGDDAGGASANSGYGYGSQAELVPLGSIDAIGPLGRTALKYEAPSYKPEPMLLQQVQALAPDDVPVFGEVPGAELDESNLSSGNLVATGTVTVNYGIDAPGAILPNGQLFAVDSVAGPFLKSGGVKVDLSQTADGYIGEANGHLVFSFAIDPISGEYTYTQYLSFDHADGSNPDDEITLQIGVSAVDNDGDNTATFILIKVADDAPIAHEVVSEADETGLGPVVVTGAMDYNYGSDANGHLSVNNNFSAGGSLAAGTLTSGGVAVTVTQTATGYIGMAGTTAVFTLHVNLNTGEYTYTQLAPLDHADGTDANDVIALNFGMDVTDFDGDTVHTTITINVADDGPVAVDEGRAAIEDQVLNGNVLDNDTLSTDASNVVTKVEFNGGFYNVPTTGTVNIIGTYGTLSIAANGEYTYTAHHNNPDGTDTFTYTLKDYDGDTSTADLSIAVSPIDDVPVIITPQEHTIDESDLGTIQINGTVQADFGTDGPGTFQLDGSFTSGGSLAAGNLTHNGISVSVSLVGNTYIGTAGGETIFSMQMNGLGEYTFTLFKSLDHADVTNPDDIITLNFGVQADDLDDDSGNGYITINVKDDGPVAANDGNLVLKSDVEVNGNLLANDDAGVDGMGDVIQVTFGGTDYAVPTGGNITIIATYGTLVVNANGDYTYTITDPDAPAGSEVFSYVMTDAEGDTSAADLSINIENRDDQPVLAAPSIHTVDETDLGTADVIVNGQLQGEFHDDGFGSFSATGSFASSGSQLGGALTSGGVPVQVAFDGTTYTGQPAQKQSLP